MVPLAGIGGGAGRSSGALPCILDSSWTVPISASACSMNAVGGFTEVCSQLIKLFQTGQVRRYALWFMLGAVALLWYLV